MDFFFPILSSLVSLLMSSLVLPSGSEIQLVSHSLFTQLRDAILQPSLVSLFSFILSYLHPGWPGHPWFLLL